MQVNIVDFVHSQIVHVYIPVSSLYPALEQPTTDRRVQPDGHPSGWCRLC